jgi:hypothetical protein
MQMLNRAISLPQSGIRQSVLAGLLEVNAGFLFAGEQSQEQVSVNESILGLQDLALLGQSDPIRSFSPPLRR